MNYGLEAHDSEKISPCAFEFAGPKNITPVVGIRMANSRIIYFNVSLNPSCLSASESKTLQYFFA